MHSLSECHALWWQASEAGIPSYNLWHGSYAARQAGAPVCVVLSVLRHMYMRNYAFQGTNRRTTVHTVALVRATLHTLVIPCTPLCAQWHSHTLCCACVGTGNNTTMTRLALRMHTAMHAVAQAVAHCAFYGTSMRSAMPYGTSMRTTVPTVAPSGALLCCL